MSAPYAWSERFPARPPATEGSEHQVVSVHPPATEAEVRRLEERLDVELSPSYRQFLLFANGWGSDDDCCLLRVDEVGWLRDVDPSIAESWSEPKPENSWSVPDELYFVYGLVSGKLGISRHGNPAPSVTDPSGTSQWAS